MMTLRRMMGRLSEGHDREVGRAGLSWIGRTVPTGLPLLVYCNQLEVSDIGLGGVEEVDGTARLL